VLRFNSPLHRCFLRVRILWELTRYDFTFACVGMRAVRSRRKSETRLGFAGDSPIESAVREAFKDVAPLYWKPVRCLQRAVVVARVMRHFRIPAEVVIGYRARPFFSHAWVEVAGRVVNDSPAYQRRLQVLERL